MSGASADFAEWSAGAYGNNIFLTSSNANGVATSPDGLNWTRKTARIPNGARDIIFHDGLFYAGNNSGQIHTSPDAEEWKLIVDYDGASVTGLLSGGDTVIAAVTSNADSISKMYRKLPDNVFNRPQ